jgi:hypothetical protein
MSTPANLYVDRMSPITPVRVADVYAATVDRADAYAEAAGKIGFTTKEYAEFRDALLAGGAIYVRLPRHIDAMAGIHAHSRHVYALKNAVIPAGTVGWQVTLADGTTILIPRACGNLSMNRGLPPAHRWLTRPIPPMRLADSPLSNVDLPVRPVAFDTPERIAAPAAGPPANGRGAIPLLGLLVPAIGAFNNHPSTSAPEIPPCSAGSNAIGVCRR